MGAPLMEMQGMVRVITTAGVAGQVEATEVIQLKAVIAIAEKV